MSGRLLASDAEADAVEIETDLEAEIDRPRKRLAELEGTLRSVRQALPMISADPDVARAIDEEIELELAIAGNSSVLGVSSSV